MYYASNVPNQVVKTCTTRYIKVVTSLFKTKALVVVFVDLAFA